MELDVQLVATATATVVYGPLRLATAIWLGKDPADVTGDDVGRYEIAYEEENGVSWAYDQASIKEAQQ